MENLAPPLEFVLHLRFSLDKGESVKSAVKEFANKSEENRCEWGRFLSKWLIYKDLGKPTTELTSGLSSLYRRSLIEVLDAGLRGESIYQTICQIEEELVEASQNELNKYVATLPFKALIPLLLFQFPAFLLLLLGPLLLNFLSAA